jgi:putative copper resistance protein D
MIDLGLVVARLLHYAAVTTLAGVAFFPLYAYALAEPKELSRRRQAVLLTAAVGALFSGLLWFVFSVANMSGTLADVTDHEILWTVLNETSFGRVWIARILLALVIVGVISVRFAAGAKPDRILSILTGALLASLAGVGHSQIEEGMAGLVHVTSDAAHLLAAGAWLGGLVPLGYILLLHGKAGRRAAHGIDLNRVLMRFSGMGYVAVATLIGSGLVNGWFLIGNVAGLFATPYGQLLIVKLVLFAGMLALAVSNRFWVVPSLTKSARTDDSNGSTAWFARLRNHVLGEQFLGLMVLLIVSILGTMRPAIGQ